MKRILGILTLLLFITACDDGDLTVDVIDFSAVQAQKCSAKDVIYKIKDSEMLFLEIPATTFTENQTLDGVPIVLSINSTNKVTYRKYTDAVTADNICPTVPDASPAVSEQWNASAGTIQIKATAVKTTDADGFEHINGYNYYIELKNVTFEKPSGPQTYETFIFGNYKTTISPLAFGFDDDAEKNSCAPRIINFSGSETLILDVGTNYSTLFANVATTTPRTALIDSTNKLTYKLFANAVNDLFFCANPTPSTPALLQEWNAVNGVAATSGIIEVSTTTAGPNSFKHTIHLKNVTLKKGNSDFTLGNDYTFGSFITNP